jgi:hypothetical protein
MLSVMRNPLTAVRLALAGLRLVRDPNRLEQAIGLADRLGETPAFLPILEHVRSLPGGPAALADRPRVAIELPYLRTLAPGTFGRATADFLDARRLDPADLPHRPASDELGWLRAHLFETHDLWHVVTGFDTDVAGEAGLQAFYLAQFRPGWRPSCWRSSASTPSSTPSTIATGAWTRSPTAGASAGRPAVPGGALGRAVGAAPGPGPGGARPAERGGGAGRARGVRGG